MSDLNSLIHRAQSGDLGAYDVLVGRYRGMALSYAGSRLRDYHLAEDAVQEALLQAYLDLGQLNEPMAFAGWLRRIVHKHCDRILRRKRARLVGLEDGDALSASNPHEELEQGERSLRLKTALQRLSAGESEILTLSYLRGLSHRQTASYLELPETTVNIRLYTARQHLKKELEAMATLEDLLPLGPIHDRLATSLESVFGESMEMTAHVAAATTCSTTYGSFIEGLGRHSATYYFIAAPPETRVTIDLSVPLSLALLNRCHSGEELEQEAEFRSSNPPDGGWLLGYQLGRLAIVIKQTFDAFVDAWRPVAELTWRDAEIQLTPHFMLDDNRLPGADDSAVVIDFTVQSDRYADLTMKLCYPTAALAALTADELVPSDV